jgi:hypothetical protein
MLNKGTIMKSAQSFSKLFTGLLLVSCFAGITTPALASRGGETGGGADVVANPKGGKSLLDLMESDDLRFFEFEFYNYDVGLLHTFYEEILGYDIHDGASDFKSRPIFLVYQSYHPFLSHSTNLSPIFNTVVARCSGFLSSRNPDGDFLYHVKPLRWAFTQQELEDIRDEGLIRVTNPATKKQVAIQKDDLVVINKKEFDSMDNESKAALKLHESVLCAMKTLNPDLLRSEGTAPIRYFVRQFVSYKNTANLPEGTPALAVTQAANKLYPAEPRKVDTNLEISGKDDDIESSCYAFMHSPAHEAPNVRVDCQTKIKSNRYAEGYFTVSDCYKIGLTPETPVYFELRGCDYNYETGTPELSGSDFHGSKAIELVRKNLKSLQTQWKQYSREN